MLVQSLKFVWVWKLHQTKQFTDLQIFYLSAFHKMYKYKYINSPQFGFISFTTGTFDLPLWQTGSFSKSSLLLFPLTRKYLDSENISVMDLILCLCLTIIKVFSYMQTSTVLNYFLQESHGWLIWLCHCISVLCYLTVSYGYVHALSQR